MTYRQQLSLVDWDSLLVSDDIDISTSNITRALIDAANTNIPNRVITVRKDNPLWLTSSIKRVIRRKNRLHNVERIDSIKEQKGQTYQVIGNDSVLPEISVIT